MLVRFVITTTMCFSWLLGCTQSFLSNQYNDRYFMVNVGIGQTAYFGELNPRFQLQQGLSHVNVGLEARLLNHISARTEVIMYQIGAKDSDAADSSFARQRNLSFESRNFEFNLQFQYYFFPYNDIFHKRRAIEPFLAAGVGLTTINPKTEFNDMNVKLRGLRTEGVDYNGTALVIPVGLGVKFKINQMISLIVESSYRLTFEDYFDDVSNVYVSSFDSELAGILNNRRGEVGVINEEVFDQLVPGNPRGNPDNNDKYLGFAFKLEYYLPPNLFNRGKSAAEN